MLSQNTDKLNKVMTITFLFFKKMHITNVNKNIKNIKNIPDKIEKLHKYSN